MTERLVLVWAATLLFFCSPDRSVAHSSLSSPSLPILRDTSDTTAVQPPQERGPTRFSPLSRSRISAWFAGSVHTGAVIGTISEGWFGLLGIRYHRLLIPTPRESLSAHDTPTLTYTADIIPIAAVSISEDVSPRSAPPETGPSTFGVGIYPLGLRVGFRPSRRFRPFVAGQAGLFYFAERVPEVRGRHFNFGVGVGGGVEIGLTRQTTVTLGYRYHHLSNGFRGRTNPGLDTNLLYVGFGTAL